MIENEQQVRPGSEVHLDEWVTPEIADENGYPSPHDLHSTFAPWHHGHISPAIVLACGASLSFCGPKSN